MPIVCRKCGGSHLTIKCGTEEKKLENIIEDKKVERKVINKNISDNNKFNKNRLDNNNSENSIKNKTIKRVNKPNYEKYPVLISNLPDDIELINLQYMMMEWGKIGNINLKYTEDKGKICYIDFYNKEHKDYFIKALDKTPVGFNIINIVSI
jgi:hypothetical protein